MSPRPPSSTLFPYTTLFRSGRQEQPFAILAATAGSSPGQATVLPTRARASAGLAALLNGTAGHALDYDDVADEIKGDRKSTRLNSSHTVISYAVFCLKKKKK